MKDTISSAPSPLHRTGARHGRPERRTSRDSFGPTCRTRRGSGTTGWAARTTTGPTGPPGTPWPRCIRRSSSWRGSPGSSSSGPCATWRRGGHPAVPRHRHRPAHHAEHPRGRPGVAPESRIVYVDNDPLVLVHARALLAGTTSEGSATYVARRLPRPASRSSPRRRRRSTSTEPVAVMFMGVLGTSPTWTWCGPSWAQVTRPPCRAATWCCGTAPTPARRWSRVPTSWRERRSPLHPAQPRRARPSVSTA